MAPAKRSWPVVLFVAAALGTVSPVLPEPPDYAAERSRMVEGLREKGITSERVLAAMRRVPRHLFVDKDSRGRAYNDDRVPGRASRPVSRPYVVALAIQILDLDADSKVLQVGAGCTYCAAVLCEITPHVHCIDFRPETLHSARGLLREAGYSSVSWKTGKGCMGGWAENAPYDAILVTCAAPREVPYELFNQLREGGRMVIPVELGLEQTLEFVRMHAKSPQAGPRKAPRRMTVTALKVAVDAEPMKCQSGSP